MSHTFAIFFCQQLSLPPLHFADLIIIEVTQFKGEVGVFWRATPAKTPPSSYQLRKSYINKTRTSG